jgi:exopolyphosphatase / guanosine-5'-triphosphate,3'-diphosphate pyrophosphatase
VRIAIVDIGTNSVRLLIAEIDDGRLTTQLDRRATVTRLGAGVDAGGRLREDAMQRTFEVLSAYRDAVDAAGVRSAHAVLTSAVRDAVNGREFAARVARDYGFVAHVLTGADEARLTYRGATSGRPPAGEAGGRTLVVDIGGGSTELIVGTGAEPSFHVSTQAGVVRQSERHVHHDPPAPGELDAVAADVRAVFEAAVPAEWRTGVAHAIAVAGTPTSLAAIAMGLEPYDPVKVHGYVLGASERDAILARMRTLPLAEREAVPGLHPARARVILPGIVILAEAMRLFALTAVEVSEHDILRGAALAYAGDAGTRPFR